MSNKKFGIFFNTLFVIFETEFTKLSLHKKVVFGPFFWSFLIKNMSHLFHWCDLGVIVQAFQSIMILKYWRKKNIYSKI